MRTQQHQQQGALVARQSFPREPNAVGAARRWTVAAYLQAGGTQKDTCALLVSELATNAVLHAVGDQFEVAVWDSGVVDVIDASRVRPVIPDRPDDRDEHGRGLILVEALSAHFEVIPFEGGKTSRFRLDEGDSHVG
ncbi:ATP-binding protein [Streptomyces sp. NPDC014748]|uniref:ATP-binding protein n=1 Tax=Streptomyces sp. NPDC014748 TaxID=3364905 RepID=UPI003700CFF8